MNRKSAKTTTEQKQQLNTTTRLSQQVAQPKRIQGYKQKGPAWQECVTCGETIPRTAKWAKAHEQTNHHKNAVDRAVAALAIVPSESAHPDTDEHRAGCTSCQYVHDSKLPDLPSLRLEGQLSPQECATVLHGLRMIQCEGRIEGCNAGDCEHFEDHEALTNEQIDTLADRINLGWINSTVDRMTAQAQESKTWTAVLAALEKVSAEVESWHSVHGHGPSSTQCDSLCALMPEMRKAIRDAKQPAGEDDMERDRRG